MVRTSSTRSGAPPPPPAAFHLPADRAAGGAFCRSIAGVKPQKVLTPMPCSAIWCGLGLLSPDPPSSLAARLGALLEHDTLLLVPRALLASDSMELICLRRHPIELIRPIELSLGPPEAAVAVQ